MGHYTWQWHGEANNGTNGWSLDLHTGGKNEDPYEYFVHPQWTTFSPSPFIFWGVP